MLYVHKTISSKELISTDLFHTIIFLVDEGVYVNNSGSLVKHAVMQWGETPHAVGENLFYVFEVLDRVYLL